MRPLKPEFRERWQLLEFSFSSQKPRSHQGNSRSEISGILGLISMCEIEKEKLSFSSRDWKNDSRWPMPWPNTKSWSLIVQILFLQAGCPLLFTALGQVESKRQFFSRKISHHNNWWQEAYMKIKSLRFLFKMFLKQGQTSFKFCFIYLIFFYLFIMPIPPPGPIAPIPPPMLLVVLSK